MIPRNSFKLAIVFLPIILLVSVSLLSAGDAFITTGDNLGQDLNPTPDGDLDVNVCYNNSELAPVEFYITVPDPSGDSAQLSIRTSSVDEESNNLHQVYLNQNYVGNLSGITHDFPSWHTSVFEVPVSWLLSGDNLVEITVAAPTCVWVDWGQITIDGGQTGNVALFDLAISDYDTVIDTVYLHTDIAVSATLTGTYSVEVSLQYPPSGRTKDSDIITFSTIAGELVTRTITSEYKLYEPTGYYELEAILFDDATSKIQAIQRINFYNILGVGPVKFDFGDAPGSTYATLLADQGARHIVVDGFYLGAGVDSEYDAQPDATASGDDVLDSNDDENGVTFTSELRQGALTNLDVEASANGYLSAWLDFNADGDWKDADEQIFARAPLVTGTNSLSFLVPSRAISGTTFARFRFSSNGAMGYYGAASDGEVEDYQVSIKEINLALHKTAQDLNGAPLFVHDLISYTVTITNVSLNSKNNIVLTDTLPAGVEFVLASGDYDGPNPLVWHVGDLAPGEVWKATILVRVDGTADPIGGNVAVVSSDEQDMQQTDPVFPPGSAGGIDNDVIDGLTLNKTAQDLNGTPLYVGDTVRYAITVTNEYTKTMSGVLVTDTLPAGLMFVAATPAGYTGPNPLLWDVGNLAPGAIWTAAITVVVDGTVTPLAGNVAAVRSDQQNEQTSEAVLPESGGEVELNPDALTLVKTAQDLNGAPLYPGDTVLYTICLTNLLPVTQTGVVITDLLPDGLNYVPGSALSSQGDISGPNPLVAHIGTLAAGQVATLTFQTIVDAGAVGMALENYAQADSEQQDLPVEIGPITPPDGGTVESMSAALNLVKLSEDLNGAPLYLGDEILYTMYLNNPLNVEQTNIVLTDHIPGGTSYIPDSAWSSQGSISGPDPLVLDVDTLAAGQTVTFSFRVIVNADALGQTIENYAQADSDQQDPPTQVGPITSPDGGIVKLHPGALEFHKTAQDLNGAPIYPGDEILYTLVVTNALAVEQTGVVITDAIPDGATFVPGSALSSQGTISGPDPLVVHIGVLEAGQIATFTFHVTVDSSAIGAEVENYAQADSDQQHPPLQVGPIVPPRPVMHPDAVESDLAVSINHLLPSNNLIYTIVAQNNGPNDADGAIVHNDAPAYIQGVSWTYVVTGGVTYELGGLRNTLHVTLTHFPVGGVITFTVAGRLLPFSDEITIVTISAPDGVLDPDETNNVAMTGYPYRLLLPIIIRD